VDRDAANLGIDLIEPRVDLQRIFDIVFGQDTGRGHDHSGIAIQRQIPLALGAPHPWHHAFLQPFARAVDIQSGAVAPQMDEAPGSRQRLEIDTRLIISRLKVLWSGTLSATPSDSKRAHRPLGLAQRQVTHQAQA